VNEVPANGNITQNHSGRKTRNKMVHTIETAKASHQTFVDLDCVFIYDTKFAAKLKHFLARTLTEN